MCLCFFYINFYQSRLKKAATVLAPIINSFTKKSSYIVSTGLIMVSNFFHLAQKIHMIRVHIMEIGLQKMIMDFSCTFCFFHPAHEIHMTCMHIIDIGLQIRMTIDYFMHLFFSFALPILCTFFFFRSTYEIHMTRMHIIEIALQKRVMVFSCLFVAWRVTRFSINSALMFLHLLLMRR